MLPSPKILESPDRTPTDRPTVRPSSPLENQCLLSHFLTTLGAQEETACTSTLWSIESCQNKVSADQYRLTVSQYLKLSGKKRQKKTVSFTVSGQKKIKLCVSSH